MRYICAIFLAICFLPFAGVAQDYSFEASVDTTTPSVGAPVTLSCTFSGAQDLPAPKVPEIDGFSVRYYGPSTHMSFVNGKGSSSISHNYLLVPLREGSFEIPAITVQYKGQSYSSVPIKIEVVAQQNLAQSAQQAQGAVTDLRGRLFITLVPDKDVAYVGEEFGVTVKLYNDNLRVNTIKYLQIYPDNFAIGAFNKTRAYAAASNGINFQVHEFYARLTAEKAGIVDMGARMELGLLTEAKRRQGGDDMDSMFGGSFFQNFFSAAQEYPIDLNASEVKVQIKPLPDEGRPEGFNGLIGDYKLTVQASPKEVKVGDPVTLKVLVSGSGSFKNISFPNVDYKDEFKAYDPSVQTSSEGKVFEQVIVPLKSSVTQIPSLSLPFFDTSVGSYRSAFSVPIAIKVTAEEEGVVGKSFDNSSVKSQAQTPQVLGQDIVFIKTNPGIFSPRGGCLCNQPLYYGVILFLALMITAGAIFYHRGERLKSDVKYARGLLAPHVARKGIKKAGELLRKDEKKAFYEELFKTMQEYLGGRFHVSSQAITAGFIDERLRPAGVNDEILNKLRELFKECDLSRFADGQFTQDVMRNSLDNLRAVVDYLERMK